MSSISMAVAASRHSHATSARPDQEHHRALPHTPSAVVACHKAHSVIQEILQGGVPCPQLRAHWQQRDKIHVRAVVVQKPGHALQDQHQRHGAKLKPQFVVAKPVLSTGKQAGTSSRGTHVWLTLPLSGLAFPLIGPQLSGSDHLYDCDTGKVFMACSMRSHRPVSSQDVLPGPSHFLGKSPIQVLGRGTELWRVNPM